MVVTCPLCACSVPSVTLFMSHLRLIHADSPGFSIQCNLQGCSRTFYKFTTYRNHVYGFHDITAIESTDEEPVVPSRADATAPASRTADPENEDWSLANGDDGENDSYAGDEFVTGISEEILQRATAMWILKTRECHRIPLSVMDAVVSGVQSLYQEAFVSIQGRIEHTLETSGVPAEVTRSALSQLTFNSPFTNVFSGLNSQHLQLQYFRKHFGLVDPVKIVLGTERKAKGIGHKRKCVEVEETMVYIPLIDTLRVLLGNHTVVAEIEKGHASQHPGRLADYCDGELMESHLLFSVHHKSLQILFYYDDVEVCNPLGSKRKIHKIGFFYFMLGNLHPKYRSRHAAIQLIALCRRELISKYSLNVVLQPIVDDIRKLETGCSLSVGGVEQTVYGTLALVSADNPASNAMGGFKESASAYLPCRQCMGTTDQTAAEFREEKFELRTLSEHLKQCTQLEDDATNRVQNSKKYGVNSRSTLLQLEYFNPVEGSMLPDVMHDLLEGVLQYELKLLLLYCTREKRYFSLASLNEKLECVELGYMEAKNRPTTIAAKTLLDTKLCQNASQTWLLGRLVPFLVGEQVPEDDRHWQNYLLLLQILDLLLAPEITVDEVSHLNTLIPEHHSEFVNIYPDSSVIPKLHYLIHTPRLILKFGPLSRHWTMRYEAKHNYFKKLAQNTGNFVNICWTLAMRHQMWVCYQWLDNNRIGQDDIEIGPGETVAERDRPDELQSTFSECYKTKWVKKDNVLYKTPSAVVLGVEEDYPQFGDLKKIFVVDQQAFLYVRKMKTTSFNEHHHAYVLEASTEYRAVPVEDLYSPFPLHIKETWYTPAKREHMVRLLLELPFVFQIKRLTHQDAIKHNAQLHSVSESKMATCSSRDQFVPNEEDRSKDNMEDREFYAPRKIFPLGIWRHLYFVCCGEANQNGLTDRGRTQAVAMANALLRTAANVHTTAAYSTQINTVATTSILMQSFPHIMSQATSYLNEICIQHGETTNHQDQQRAEQAYHYFLDLQSAQRTGSGFCNEFYICHPNMIKYLVARLLGVSLQDFATQNIQNCSITHIDILPEGEVSVVIINDINHLSDL